jgi:homoserine dehydrogenase
MTTPLKIAIAGLGTVGVGVVKLLQQEAALLQARAGRPLELVAVNARSKDKDRVVTFGDAQWIDDAQALADTDADLVVELIGGSEGVAKSLLEASLAKGKSVVTANKALIAHHGAALATLAEANNAQLRFDAAVAGGIPIIDVMQYGVVANRFTRVAGILNGTGNYILTTMQKDGRDFDEVLKEAQELGYAEADPSFDVDGIDTAHKLAILCALAYSTQPNLDAITIEGIRSVSALDMRYAAELGYVIKLLGVAEQTEYGIMQRVHPCMVPADAPIGRIDGAFNAVQLEGLAVGRVLLEGQGAGEGPTASSVVSDIVQIARGSQTHAFTLRAADLAPLTPAHMSQLQSSYYLRLSVRDEPGVLADITAICARERISVQSLIQHEHTPDGPAHIVMSTHETSEASMQKALAAIGALETVIQTPQMIRIQEF